jgi:hypothetical protein
MQTNFCLIVNSPMMILNLYMLHYAQKVEFPLFFIVNSTID